MEHRSIPASIPGTEPLWMPRLNLYRGLTINVDKETMCVAKWVTRL